MSRILIGSGNTDSDGLVTGEYTGSSKGRVQFVAYNKERTLSSEIYVIDAIFKDIATIDNHNDSMWSVARGTLNRGTEDTELVLNTGQSNVMAYFNLTNTDSFVIEFDCILDYSQRNGIQLRSADWTVVGQLNISNLSKDTYHHVKCSVSNGTVSWTVDDGNPIINSITNVGMFNFYKTSSDNYFKYRNFKYYQI